MPPLCMFKFAAQNPRKFSIRMVVIVSPLRPREAQNRWDLWLFSVHSTQVAATIAVVFCYSTVKKSIV